MTPGINEHRGPLLTCDHIVRDDIAGRKRGSHADQTRSDTKRPAAIRSQEVPKHRMAAAVVQIDLCPFVAGDDIGLPRFAPADPIEAAYVFLGRKDLHADPLGTHGLRAGDIRSDQIANDAVPVWLEEPYPGFSVAADDVSLARWSLTTRSIAADDVLAVAVNRNAAERKVDDLQTLDGVPSGVILDVRFETTGQRAAIEDDSRIGRIDDDSIALDLAAGRRVAGSSRVPQEGKRAART